MSLIELACRDASCAPPPTGTGGSLKTATGGTQYVGDTMPDGFITEATESAERIFNFEFTDRNGRKFVAKTDEIEEGDDGGVTVMGTIFAAGPRVKGRRRPTTVGFFTREIDGWRMHHDSLSVMPQHQGKGIGSAFIAESMRRAADEGVTQVDVLAVSTKTSSNGVYTWLRAGFDTPTGMIGRNKPLLKKLGDRYMAAGDMVMAKRLWDGNPIATADLLTSPVAKEALGASPVNVLTMNLQMDISDLKTEAALAASVFTDWVERAITFTLDEDETWYEPLADEDLTAAGCQSADCAPPPVGTGGSRPGSEYMPGVVDWVDGYEIEGTLPVFDPDSDAGKRILELANRWQSGFRPFTAETLRNNPGEVWLNFIGHEESRKWLSTTVRAGAEGADLTLLRAIHESMRLRFRDPDSAMVPVWRSTTRKDRDPFAPDTFWKEQSVAPDKPGTGLTSWLWSGNQDSWDDGNGMAISQLYGHAPLEEDNPDVPLPNITGDVPVSDVLGWFGDMVMQGEVIVGRPGLVQRLLRGEPSDEANAALTASAEPFAGLEVYGFACHDASCAPPPIGTGGSTPGVDIPGIADQEAYDRYRETTNNVQLLDIETAAYAQQQIQDAEVVVRISADRLSDILNYSEPEDWELRSMHDPQNEVGRSLRGEDYLQHRDLYDAAVGLDMGYVVHGYSEAEFSLEPIQAPDDPNPFEISHRVTPQAAAWYGDIQLVMTDEARDDATFTISDSLNSGSVPLPIEGPIDPRAAALNGAHPYQLGRDYAEVQLRAPIELSSKHVKEIRVPDIYHLQDVIHVLAERMPDTLVTIEDDGIMMTMENAVTALEELQS